MGAAAMHKGGGAGERRGVRRGLGGAAARRGVWRRGVGRRGGEGWRGGEAEARRGEVLV